MNDMWLSRCPARIMGLLLCVIEASTSPIPHAIACLDDLSRTIREIPSAGTTSQDPSSILMTANEVNLHKERKGQTALAIVSSILLTKGAEPLADGGRLDMQVGWDIDEWKAVPTAYRFERIQSE